MRAVGRERVQRLRVQPLGVLVESDRPQAELGALLQQRGEVARGGAVVGLDLVEEDPEGPARARARARRGPWRRAAGRRGAGWRAAGRGCRPSRGRRGRSARGPSPRAPGRCSGSGRAGRVIGGRGAQAVDQVGQRRDRLFGEQREAVEPEALRGRRQERQDRVAPALVGEQGRELEDRRRQLGRQDLGDLASARPPAWSG